MKLTFLGSGTSTGVPQVGCKCEVCRSNDSHDKRLRASVLLETEGENILIDCSPDFREQMLRLGSPGLDCMLTTHSHYDHVGGLDDLRPYCKDKPFPIYCSNDVAEDIRERLPYCFREHPYPGVPSFDMHIIGTEKFNFKGIEIQPLRIMHAQLPILGFRIGNFAYVTDAKTIPTETMDKLKGLDLLVINALRIDPHMSHLSLGETMGIINELKPQRVVLTHMSHQIGLHNEVVKKLPSNCTLAYDGMVCF